LSQQNHCTESRTERIDDAATQKRRRDFVFELANWYVNPLVRYLEHLPSPGCGKGIILALSAQAQSLLRSSLASPKDLDRRHTGCHARIPRMDLNAIVKQLEAERDRL